MKEIIYSGASHYGAGALLSLQKEFEKVYVLDICNAEIKALLRDSDEIIYDFDDVSCGLVFLGGHAGLISEKQLSAKTYINVHGALLPRWRGMHPTFWAIYNGDKELGVTYHLVNKDMDAGDILAQYAFRFYGQTIAEVNREIDDIIREHTGAVVREFCEKKIIPKKQDISRVTFGCRRNLDDCLIDFHSDTGLLKRFFLALTEPYPLPMIRVRGRKCEVLEYEIIDSSFIGAVGRVLNIDDRGVWIKTEDGFLIVKSIRDYESGEISDPRKHMRIGYRL